MNQPVICAVGTLSQRGVLTLSKPLQQILRALLIKWIRQCERGANSAREMLAARMRPMKEGQLEYWKAAASILGQKLCTLTGDTISLREELEIVAGMTDDCPIPEAWREGVELAELMGVNDVFAEPTPIGGRDVRGEPSGEPAGKGRRRKGKADGSGGEHHRRPVRRADQTVRTG